MIETSVELEDVTGMLELLVHCWMLHFLLVSSKDKAFAFSKELAKSAHTELFGTFSISWSSGHFSFNPMPMFIAILNDSPSVE